MTISAPRLDGANHLREARKALDLSQSQVAREVDISQSYLSHLERGDYWPTLPIAFRLATTLHRTVDELWKPAGPWPALRPTRRMTPRHSTLELVRPGRSYVSPLDQLRARLPAEDEGR